MNRKLMKCPICKEWFNTTPSIMLLHYRKKHMTETAAAFKAASEAVQRAMTDAGKSAARMGSVMRELSPGKIFWAPCLGNIDWLTQVAADIHANKLRHGWKVTTLDDWKDPHEIPAVLALVHSEVSEALEAFRKSDFDNFREELADVAIRLIGLADGLGIDMKAEIIRKVEKNRHRDYRHGGKRV